MFFSNILNIFEVGMLSEYSNVTLSGGSTLWKITFVNLGVEYGYLDKGLQVKEKYPQNVKGLLL